MRPAGKSGMIGLLEEVGNKDIKLVSSIFFSSLAHKNTSAIYSHIVLLIFNMIALTFIQLFIVSVRSVVNLWRNPMASVFQVSWKEFLIIGVSLREPQPSNFIAPRVCIILRVNCSAKCKIWRVSRDADVKNHDLGGVIARSCKGREIADAILHTQNSWNRNSGP